MIQLDAPTRPSTASSVRTLAAAAVAAHGLIHLIGFIVPWRLAELEGFAYRTTVLGGGLELGAIGVRVIGLAWLAIAAGFLVAARGVWRRSAWAPGLAAALATASLVVCGLGLPETAAGVAVNPVLLAAVAGASVRGHGLAAPHRERPRR
jgi:hypothetical protein